MNVFSIDASRTVGHICQLVNDGPQAEANCKMKLKIINKQPKLCLFAIKDIASGQELTYDYGDQARNLWWRRKVGMSTYSCVYIRGHFIKLLKGTNIRWCNICVHLPAKKLLTPYKYTVKHRLIDGEVAQYTSGVINIKLVQKGFPQSCGAGELGFVYLQISI